MIKGTLYLRNSVLSINFNRLRELCPEVDDWLFNDFKEGDAYKWPQGRKVWEEGFSLPYAELPKYLNSPKYSGLLRGIVLYRLEVGE